MEKCIERAPPKGDSGISNKNQTEFERKITILKAEIVVKYPLPPSFLVHKSCDRGCWLVYPVKQGHLPHTGQKCPSLVQSTTPGCSCPELCHSWEIGVIAAGKPV